MMYNTAKTIAMLRKTRRAFDFFCWSMVERAFAKQIQVLGAGFCFSDAQSVKS